MTIVLIFLEQPTWRFWRQIQTYYSNFSDIPPWTDDLDWVTSRAKLDAFTELCSQNIK